MLPTGSGPYLLSDYLDCWDVMITSNRRNIDQHISLLRWLVEDNRYEVVSLELGSDKYIPWIALQDDGDDNLILGLAVDKISLYEKIKIHRGMEFEEFSPRCILLCLTCDGKLTLYHAAWVSEPSDLQKMAFPHVDNIVNDGLCTVSSAERELRATTSRLENELDALISDKIHISPGKPDIGAGEKMGSHAALDGAEPCSHPGLGMITSSYSKSSIEEPSMPSSAGDLGTNSKIYVMANDSTGKGTVTSKTLGSTITMGSTFGSQTPHEPSMPSCAEGLCTNSTTYTMASDSSTIKRTLTSKTLGSTISLGSTFGPQTPQKPFGVDCSNTSPSSTVKGTGTSEKVVISSRTQTVKPFTMDATTSKHFLSSPGESSSAGIGNKILSSPPSNCPSYLNRFGTLGTSEKINQSDITTSSTKSGYTGPTSILPSSSVAASAKMLASRQQLLVNTTSSKPRQRFESETQQFSKQFYNVKDMAKELDALLFSIEYEGGFKDLCTVFQEQPLSTLEAGLDNLSEVLFVYKKKIENQLMEIHQLRNKMLEVSARQVYMDGIVQQASDHRYWGICNNQKLRPEFEVKRLHISNLKQNLTNQLIELERHFNRLEINRFDEYDTTPKRAQCRSSAPSRQIQSLHSVYSTVNSQLAAAEQLSECLSKQMAVLNISSPTSEKQNVTKKLFESIGLDPKTDAFMSPDLKRSKVVPYSSQRTSLSSATAFKEQSWKCAPNAAKAFELESVRRKIDSLDKSWVHFEPSRTTIKRTSKKELVISNLDIPFREAKEVFDSQVKAFDIAQKAGGMGNFSGASSEPLVSQAQAFGITKRTSNGTASSPSKITFSNSHSFEQSPSKGGQEKSSKSIFKWAKEPSDLSSEHNTSSSSHSSQMFQSTATQPSSFAAPSIYSNSSSNKVEKFASPFTSSIDASSALSFSSSAAAKTALLSKSISAPTHMKFSSAVSPMKTASAAETRSLLLNQGTSLQNEVDILASSAQVSTKNSIAPSSILSASIAQAAATSPSSSLPSFQFEKSMLLNNSLSPSKSKTPSSFSNELNSKYIPSLSRVHASEGSLSLNKIGSELENATSQSANNAAEDGPAKELSSLTSKISSELKEDASQASISEIFPPKKDLQITPQTPATSIAPPSTTNESVLPAASNFLAEEKLSSSIMTTEKDEDANLSQEDEMEEEALDTNSVLNMDALGGFSMQSTLSSNAVKTNPFGSTGSASPLGSWNASPGQLFRPSSFNLPESQRAQQSQSTGSSSLTGLSSGFSGFGQPAQLGAGQQALGSVLGTFGQSRQLGVGAPGFAFASAGNTAAGSSGGFANVGGFAGAATGGGFSGVASNISGGFAGVGAGGGFAGAASFSGGFAGAAASGGGFARAGSGGGIASGGGGGFGGFGAIQGGGFPALGAGNSSAGRPPAELLTQMRK